MHDHGRLLVTVVLTASSVVADDRCLEVMRCIQCSLVTVVVIASSVVVDSRCLEVYVTCQL